MGYKKSQNKPFNRQIEIGQSFTRIGQSSTLDPPKARAFHACSIFNVESSSKPESENEWFEGWRLMAQKFTDYFEANNGHFWPKHRYTGSLLMSWTRYTTVESGEIEATWHPNICTSVTLRRSSACQSTIFTSSQGYNWARCNEIDAGDRIFIFHIDFWFTRRVKVIWRDSKLWIKAYVGRISWKSCPRSFAFSLIVAFSLVEGSLSSSPPHTSDSLPFTVVSYLKFTTRIISIIISLLMYGQWSVLVRWGLPNVTIRTVRFPP